MWAPLWYPACRPQLGREHHPHPGTYVVREDRRSSYVWPRKATANRKTYLTSNKRITTSNKGITISKKLPVAMHLLLLLFILYFISIDSVVQQWFQWPYNVLM